MRQNLFLLAVLWLALSGSLAAGQMSNSGVVRGRVLGADGQPIAGAEVWLRPEGDGTGAPGMRVRTGRRGDFVALGLAGGTYRVELMLPGVPIETSGVFALQTGEVLEVAVRPGSGAGELTVVSLPGWQAGSAEEVSSGAIPVADRQWENEEEVSAGTHDTTLADGGAAQDAVEDDTAASRAERETGSAATGLSVAGLPATQDAQTLDGLSADQGFRSGPRGSASGGPGLRSGFAQGAVRSVRTLSQTFSAQTGGAAGALVAVTSRRAGEQLHGSAFFQARESAWAATNPFAVVTRYRDGVVSSSLQRPADAEEQVGGSLGLPLLRGGRMGVFGAVEVQRRAETLIATPQTAGFFQLSATQSALLANRGVGTAAVRAALDYIDGLGGKAAVNSPRTLGFVRLDERLGRRDGIDVAGQVQRSSAPALSGGGLAEGVVSEAVSSIGSSRVEAEAVSGGWEHGFGSRATNSVRAQVALDLEFETPGAPVAGVPAIAPGGYAPEVLIEPEGFRYGTPASLGRVAYPDEHRVQVADAFQVRAGRHLIALGGDWSRLHDRVLSATNLEGTFLYDSDVTGGHAGGLVDWITDYTFNVHAYPNGGCPSIFSAVHDFCFRSYSQSFAGSGTGTGAGATEFVTHNVAGFAEDAIRLGSGLQLTLGARYDYLLLPLPQAPNAALDAALANIGGPASGMTSRFPEDRNNVGPRLSLAWSPERTGRRGREHGFTVRAGYGVFYGRLPGATVQAALADTALPGARNSTNSIRILPTTETNCPQVANQGFGYPCAFLAEPAGVVARTGSAVVFARNFRLPAVQRGSFALQQTVGRHVVMEAEYATTWATQLPASVDINVAPSTSTASFVLQGGAGQPGLQPGETFQLPLYTARRTALYGPVTAIESNANATFHSATAKLTLQTWHGLSLKGDYAFSRAIDYGAQSSPVPRQNGQLDPFTNGYDKGLSSLQFAHQFAGTLNLQSRWQPRQRELRAVTSGWRLDAIGTAGSGAPYSYTVFGGSRLTGGHESLNGSGGATYLPTVGRNTLRLPMRSKLDLRAARELPIGARWRVEVHADALNVLNTVSLSRIETRAFLVGTASAGTATPLIFQDAATVAAEGVTTPAFGTPLSSTSALSRERALQVGARFRF